jgi:hypothetical protein
MKPPLTGIRVIEFEGIGPAWSDPRHLRRRGQDTDGYRVIAASQACGKLRQDCG